MALPKGDFETYEPEKLKRAFLLLAISGELDGFAKECEERKLLVYMKREDRDFVRDRLIEIVKKTKQREKFEDKGMFVAVTGCPC